MPSLAENLIYSLIQTISMGLAAIALSFFAVYMMERLAPFSIRKEIEEDHNVSAAILCGSVILGVALVVASVAHG